MSEISTVAVITAKPGSGPIVEAALRELAAATHQEEGCILYSLQRSVSDENVFVTVEKWTSQAALDQHLNSPHVQSAIGGAKDHFGAPLQIITTEFLDAGDEAKRTY